MKTLDKQRYEEAITYMKEKARPLERAIYEHSFEGGAAEAVVRELLTFQNPDGGFGHGLEPDLRTPHSSALATTNTLAILKNLPSHEEALKMAHQALGFLADTYQADRVGWEIIPKEAEEAPRAVWWTYNGFDAYWGNPNADIVAYFIAYQTTFPYERLETVKRQALHYLLHESELTEMHEMLCYLNLNERLSEQEQLAIQHKLLQFLDQCVMTGEQQGYGARPLQVADSPNSRYAARYAAHLPDELNKLIDEQGEDGAWSPNWTWHQYEQEWEQAREEWKGILTLQALRTLQAYHRLP
ncbi:hypothetical protein [Paenibacillus daejeonensis]|uniref:hypothetical protein n=1 Tax=Paenibacillus daejeonensis TaxID=135193 RepID=UPI000365932C|nr:hypothetical protein [Paenibacillus daejeonensis]